MLESIKLLEKVIIILLQKSEDREAFTEYGTELPTNCQQTASNH